MMNDDDDDDDDDVVKSDIDQDDVTRGKMTQYTSGKYVWHGEGGLGK